jgi:NADP-dependent 3-hydroxy acid dehydrogenase YdfG
VNARADLTGQVAAITGASSGIGEATAVALAGAGAAVSLAARRTDRIKELARRIEDDGGRALAIETADTSEWRQMVEVNLLGLLYCTHTALPIMGEQGSGHIVNISSVAGRFATLGSAVYNLTKFGVNAFSEALRQELAAANVKVTVIEPGFVSTELQAHNTHPMVVEAIERMRNEIGQPLEADDIAQAILYAVAAPDRVAVNEVLVRPAGQRR